MPSPRRRFIALSAVAEQAIGQLRESLDVPAAFPPAVEATAADAARNGPQAPAGGHERWADRTEIPFITIDPAGSVDLDQALHLERSGDGYLLHYAIADVAAWVRPGDAIDIEARHRGLTLYAPDGRAPLHPNSLGEGAASLLPGVDRPAVCWRFRLGADGAVDSTDVERCVVRSRAALSYSQAQAALDGGGGAAAPFLAQLHLLAEVGARRAALETARGGVSLDLPEQEVEPVDGGYELTYRTMVPIERWNAQLSLLTGMEAARLMASAGVGIVRTLPPPGPEVLARLRRQSAALGVAWADEVTYPDWVRGLDQSDPRAAALANQAARALRGASYAPLQPAQPVPTHAAIAAPYAHVTAPLRRLVDRFGSEVALAVSSGAETPAWVIDTLGDLPRLMGQASQRAARLEHGVVDLVEALVLVPYVGQRFDAVVVDSQPGGSQVQLRSPAVVATVDQRLELGASVEVQLEAADPVARRVQFRVA